MKFQVTLALVALSACHGLVYLDETNYPLRTAACQYVMEDSSYYTGKWIATGRGRSGDEYHSCLTEEENSVLCLTWNYVEDCYDYTNGVKFDTNQFHECSENASGLSHSWCYRALESRWANCIYSYNRNSQFHEQWVIAHSYDNDGTYCYDYNGKCIAYDSFDECQDTADQLQVWYEEDGIDRLGKRCTSVDESSGWCYAAFLILGDGSKDGE
ncbi:hypothetical protein SARC_03652 [Sphaeroforma arctica JP610]|uniref:Uncharacterized protein n=1 Tax=Sphaeroforma arctica JP610 TaxID=667725 RepID=A0A0L0G5P0_9EUKA|nr:hypothetical protein SARC_03652 [Sphaeroforma arctica JP610]KNC84131.1 hypothetical protein SARC_03652 [Sphaeroforma arctica JP610]|eukprot:XP_014158033.1 hypothetical protein SARC_03652 [Sphaeroforma arctica JP610]